MTVFLLSLRISWQYVHAYYTAIFMSFLIYLPRSIQHYFNLFAFIVVCAYSSFIKLRIIFYCNGINPKTLLCQWWTEPESTKKPAQNKSVSRTEIHYHNTGNITQATELAQNFYSHFYPSASTIRKKATFTDSNPQGTDMVEETLLNGLIHRFYNIINRITNPTKE